MATTNNAFDDLVNGVIGLTEGAINVGFGAAAVAAEKSKEVLDDLNAKGEEVRNDAQTPDIFRSISDAFKAAGGTISETVERLSTRGETVNEKVLDELILMRARQIPADEREEYLTHVQNLIRSIPDEGPVNVEVEADEPEAADAAAPEDVADVDSEPVEPAGSDAAE